MTNGAWPRPSDARRVRLALHLFEGTLIGGALALGAGLLLGLSRVVGGAVGNDPLSLVLVALVVVALVRGGLAVAADRSSGPDSSEPYRDWRRARRPRLVGVVALCVAVTLLAAALVLGGDSLALPLRLLGAPTLLLGTLGYAFVLHRVGVRI
ncbi:hypothetical protein ACFQE8_04430 [Salinirubellus sp. GCM10025818]|jgi:hypothetical protein|uniref:hypothetical protein n=1 Tax=Salinirubellus TaxID=2162630 RepID=UPI0030CE0609